MLSLREFGWELIKFCLVPIILELKEFRQIIDEFIIIAETIVGEVEQEKMQAIAAQNHLKSNSKQRESAQQEIQVKCQFKFKKICLILESFDF